MLQVHRGLRFFSTATVEKVKKKVKVIKTVKISEDILKHFDTSEKKEILNQFPHRLLSKKYKAPDNFYVADKSIAQSIAVHLTKGISSRTTLVEANPGPGLITEELIRSGAGKILLFEPFDIFIPKLRELASKQPNRIYLKNGDFVNLWKLAFQDKYDGRSRATEFLEEIPKKEWTSDTNFRMFVGVGTLNFFKHLINSIVFQTSLLTYGRPEMYLAVPPPLYINLTCNKDAGYLFYRSTSVLFQIMFEHQFIGLYPRKSFLPFQFDYNNEKNRKLARVNVIDSDYLYLVKITPRKNLFNLCPLENLQGLWYFVKQNLVSRRNRIIPNLEKWVPGCGPRLILNNKKSEKLKILHKSSYLPKFSTECTTMSNQDFYPNIDILTEYGDLSPSQLLTLFCEFRNWPEYQHSPFLASLENNLLKMETSNEEHVDGVEITEEDDNSPDDENKDFNGSL